MSAPLISVIVPVYNTEKYLRKCLDSICGQTYRNLEILCVNDGSADGSAAILEEYAARDARIKIITQSNAGQGAARNAALQVATGEWVTGVDSDDYLEPDAYEYALSAVADDVDIICFGTNIVWDDVVPDAACERSFQYPTTGKHTPNPELVAKTNVVFWNKIWRRSFVEQLHCRFPLGLWYEDFYFWRALAPFARCIAYLPEKKINYVRQSNSIISNYGTANPKTLDHISIIDCLLEYFKSHPLPWPDGALDAFLFSYQCAMGNVPPLLHPRLAAGYLEVARKHGMITRYASALRFLIPTSPLTRLFATHRPGKSTYGLPGIKFLSIQYKFGKKITRFLGIRIRHTHC